PRVPVVYDRFLPRRGTCRFRWCYRCADPVSLSGPRLRHASTGAGGRHSGWHGQPARIAGREFRYGVPLQLRAGARSGARLFRAVSSHGADAACAPARAIWAARVMSVRYPALLLMVVAAAAAPFWLPGSYYVNIASQILIYAVFALAVDVLLGYGGLVSLGH